MVDDASLLARFEDLTLPAAEFSHRTHVRVAWLYLRDAPFEVGAARFCTNLRRFTTSLGKADRYHETITWAYLALVNERLRRAGAPGDFESFARENADLFDPKHGALGARYDEQTLRSELARRAFVLPRTPPSN